MQICMVAREGRPMHGHVLLAVLLLLCAIHSACGQEATASCMSGGANPRALQWWLVYRDADTAGWLYVDSRNASALSLSPTAGIWSRASPLFTTVASLWGGPPPPGAAGSRDLPLTSGYTGFTQADASGGGRGDNGGLLGYSYGAAAGDGVERPLAGFALLHRTAQFPARARRAASAEALDGHAHAHLSSAARMESPYAGGDALPWVGSTLASPDFFVCISLESREALEAVAHFAAHMRAVVTVSSVLEGAPYMAEQRRPDVPLPPAEPPADACIRNASACCGQHTLRTGNATFSLVSISPFQLRDTCLHQPHPAPADGASAPSEWSVMAESQFGTMPGQALVPELAAFALVTHENVLSEAERYMDLLPTFDRPRPFLPVCFGSLRPFPAYAAGYGSGLLCFHNEPLWMRMWSAGAVYEESCKSALALLEESPVVLSLEAQTEIFGSSSATAAGAGGGAPTRTSFLEENTRRGQVYRTRNVGTLPTQKRIPSSSPLRDLGDTKTSVVLTMHEGGTGDLFSLRTADEGSIRSTLIDSGSRDIYLNGAVESLTKRGSANVQSFHGLVSTTSFARNTLGTMHYGSQVVDEGVLMDALSDSLRHLIRGRDVDDDPFVVYMNSLRTAALQIFRQYAMAVRKESDDIAEEVDMNLMRAVIKEEPIEADCSKPDGAKIGKRSLELEQELEENVKYENKANENADLALNLFAGDVIDGPLDAEGGGGWELVVLSPSKNEFYCLGAADVFAGRNGIYDKIVAFMKLSGVSKWSENDAVGNGDVNPDAVEVQARVEKGLDTVIELFQRIPIRSKEYRNLGPGGEWEPSELKDDDPYYEAGAKVQGNSLQYMSLVLGLRVAEREDEEIKSRLAGILSSSSLPKSIVLRETLKEQGWSEKYDGAIQLDFMSIPGHGSFANHARDVFALYEPAYYLFSSGQQALLQPDFEVLKTIIDVRRPLRNNGAGFPCRNADGSESSFTIILMHDQLRVAESSTRARKNAPSSTGVQVPSDSEERGFNVLYTLMYDCKIENIDEWFDDPILAKFCFYSPACRKYSLGFVTSEPEGKPDSFPWFSLTLDQDEHSATSITPSFAFDKGFVIDCNGAAVLKDRGYIGCETSYLYDQPPRDGHDQKHRTLSTLDRWRKDACNAIALTGLKGCKDIDRRCAALVKPYRPRKGPFGTQQGDLATFERLKKACADLVMFCRHNDAVDCSKLGNKPNVAANISLIDKGKISKARDQYEYTNAVCQAMRSLHLCCSCDLQALKAKCEDPETKTPPACFRVESYCSSDDRPALPCTTSLPARHTPTESSGPQSEEFFEDAQRYVQQLQDRRNEPIYEFEDLTLRESLAKNLKPLTDFAAAKGKALAGKVKMLATNVKSISNSIYRAVRPGRSK